MADDFPGDPGHMIAAALLLLTMAVPALAAVNRDVMPLRAIDRLEQLRDTIEALPPASMDRTSDSAPQRNPRGQLAQDWNQYCCRNQWDDWNDWNNWRNSWRNF